MIKTSLLIFSCLSLAAAFSACEKNYGGEKSGPPPIAVAVYDVTAKSVSFVDLYPATVTAIDQVELRPEVSGNIVGIHFKDGQRVAKGMKLYTIDQRQYRAAYEQAIANSNVARAALARVQQDVDRYRDLEKSDAIARQQLEHAEADLESAKMQLAAATANAHAVETNLRYSVISAPFEGTIGVSSVRVGSPVAAGQTLLNTISSDSPMAADFAIDEKQLERFRILMHDSGTPGDSTFTLQLPDQTLYPSRGRLILLDRAVNSQTGTLRGRVEFPNSDGVLRAGLTCDLRVRNATPALSTLIPYRAVIEQMGEYFVFVVRGNRAEQQRITLGASVGNLVMVNNGLTPGDKIVVEGIQRLRDNALVSVSNMAAR